MNKLAIFAVAMAAGIASAAQAGVSIVSATPTYYTENVTENVEVCKTEEAGDPLANLITGAIIGQNLESDGQDGGGAVGAVLGLLGTPQGGTKCHTETRVKGTRQIHDGYNLRINVDGSIQTIRVMK